MKKIKDPRKVVERARLKTLAWWVTRCAEHGMSMSGVTQYGADMQHIDAWSEEWRNQFSE